MSAWCAELHEQLRLLAGRLELPLMPMGGHAASRRLKVADQRGSRDNDYLTTATEEDVEMLMDELTARFAPHYPAPLFRHRRLKGGEDAEPLPLASFMVDVPSQLDANDAVIAVKLEFHLETDTSLFPDSETVEGSFYGLTDNVTARLPRLPYQIGFKLLTLHEAPVGLLPKHEPAVPRQLRELTRPSRRPTEQKLAAVTGAPPRSLGLYPRRGYWQHLAQAADLSSDLNDFESSP